MTTKKPAVVRVDAVVRALQRRMSREGRFSREWYGLAEAVCIVRRLAWPAQRKGKRK